MHARAFGADRNLNIIAWTPHSLHSPSLMAAFFALSSTILLIRRRRDEKGFVEGMATGRKGKMLVLAPALSVPSSWYLPC